MNASYIEAIDKLADTVLIKPISSTQLCVSQHSSVLNLVVRRHPRIGTHQEVICLTSRLSRDNSSRNCCLYLVFRQNISLPVHQCQRMTEIQNTAMLGNTELRGDDGLNQECVSEFVNGTGIHLCVTLTMGTAARLNKHSVQQKLQPVVQKKKSNQVPLRATIRINQNQTAP